MIRYCREWTKAWAAVPDIGSDVRHVQQLCRRAPEGQGERRAVVDRQTVSKIARELREAAEQSLTIEGVAASKRLDAGQAFGAEVSIE